MKTAINLFLFVSALLLSAQGFAQQWSNDPATDSIKKGTAALIKYQGVIEYCKGEHSHDKECAGIYDNIPWTYMSYDDALKLGQKQLDEANAKKQQGDPEQISPADAARRFRYLKALESTITDFCSKNPVAKPCTARTPYQNALLLLPSVLAQAKANEEAKTKAAPEPAKKQ